MPINIYSVPDKKGQDNKDKNITVTDLLLRLAAVGHSLKTKIQPYRIFLSPSDLQA